MKLVLVAVLVTFSAQQLLTPLLAPLSRELELTESQLGVVITAGAIGLTVFGPVWGRAVDRIGPRAVLLGGVGTAAIGLTGFAIVGHLGLADRTGPGVTFALFLATRSLFFGAGISAVPVVATALAANSTTDEVERTKAISRVGAVQGVALVVGPALGAPLASLSLLLPLYAAPAALLFLLLALAVWHRPAGPVAAPTSPLERTRLSPFDPRLLPVLGICFALYLSLAAVQIVLGFVVVDRLGLTAERAAGTIGAALLITGVALVVTQGLIVPRLRWPALRLLRVGAPLSALAFVVLTVAPDFWSITAGLVLLAGGLGLAIPGFTTAPTLLVGPDEQGAIAGLLTGTIGLTFVIGPVLGTSLYEVAPLAPILVSLGLCVGASLFLFLAPAARRIGVTQSLDRA